MTTDQPHPHPLPDLAFLNGILHQKLNYSNFRYDSLLSFLQSAIKSNNANYLVEWLKIINKSIPSLTKDFHRLVEILLSFDWFSCCFGEETDVVVSEEVKMETLEIFTSFFMNLVSIHPFYSQLVLKMLVGNLQWKPSSTASFSDSQIYDYVHERIRRLLLIIPVASPFVLACLKEIYPHSTEPLSYHRALAENILKICDYIPSLRYSLLEFVIERLVELDLQIQQDFPLSSSRSLEQGDENESGSLLFEAESHSFDEKELILRENYEKVDSFLLLLLDYLTSLKERSCLDLVFNHLLVTFEKLILSTFKSKFVQCFMFYLTSLSTEYADVFLGMLMSELVKSTNISDNDVIRIVSASYIASFVARARFLEEESIIWCFYLLVDWAENYLIIHEDPAISCNIAKHSVFYSVIQAIMYIFCFRHQLLLSKSNVRFRLQNSLTKIISSNLNPLKVCTSGVVEEFAKTAANYQVVYCYSILEKNKKLSSSSNQEASELLTFFPFDPIKLKLSGKYIVPGLFIEWKECEITENAQKIDDDYENSNCYSHPQPRLLIDGAIHSASISREMTPIDMNMVKRSASYLLMNFNEDINEFLDA